MDWRSYVWHLYPLDKFQPHEGNKSRWLFSYLFKRTIAVSEALFNASSRTFRKYGSVENRSAYHQEYSSISSCDRGCPRYTKGISFCAYAGAVA
eukprot:scaffold2880_cov379-Pavlova_lutheri.AAC.3